MKCHFKWENKWHSFPKSTTAMEIYDLSDQFSPGNALLLKKQRLGRDLDLL
jgi:hypothetical protein